MNKLCICIPTYNRLKYLKELIASIEPYLSADVGVAISDNASTDASAAYLHALVERYPRSVSININSANLGPDRNYQLAVATANAEFCWLMGSDDCVRQGAIPRVLRYLEGGVDIVVSSRVDCTIDMREVRVRSWFKDPGQLMFNLQKQTDQDRFFGSAKGAGALFSYLSTTIVRKASWDSVAYDGALDGSAYSHAYILLKAALDGSRIVIVTEPFVLARGGNDHFLQSGEAKRILLDLDGYSQIAHMLKASCSVDALLSLVRKEQPWWRIWKLGALLSTSGQAKRAACSLEKCNYSALTILLMRFSYIFPWPVRLAALGKKACKKWFK